MGGGLLFLIGPDTRIPQTPDHRTFLVLVGVGMVVSRSQNQPILMDHGEELQKTPIPHRQVQAKEADSPEGRVCTDSTAFAGCGIGPWDFPSPLTP